MKDDDELQSGSIEDEEDTEWWWGRDAEVVVEENHPHDRPERPSSAALQAELCHLRKERMLGDQTSFISSFLHKNIKNFKQNSSEKPTTRILEAMSGILSTPAPQAPKCMPLTLPPSGKLAETLSGRVSRIVRRKPLPPARENTLHHVNTAGISRELQSTTVTGICKPAQRPGCSDGISRSTRAAIAARLREIFPRSTFRDTDVVLRTTRKVLPASQKPAVAGSVLNIEPDPIEPDPSKTPINDESCEASAMFPRFEAMILGKTAPASVCCGKPLLVELDVRDGVLLSCSNELCAEAVVRISNMQESFRRQVWGKWMKMNAFLLPPRSKIAPGNGPTENAHSGPGMPPLHEVSQEDDELLEPGSSRASPHSHNAAMSQVSEVNVDDVQLMATFQQAAPFPTPGWHCPGSDTLQDIRFISVSQQRSLTKKSSASLESGHSSDKVGTWTAAACAEHGRSITRTLGEVRSPTPGDKNSSSAASTLEDRRSRKCVEEKGTLKKRVLRKESEISRTPTPDRYIAGRSHAQADECGNSKAYSVGAGQRQVPKPQAKQHESVIKQFPKRPTLIAHTQIRRPTASSKANTDNGGFFLGQHSNQEGMENSCWGEKQTDTPERRSTLRGSMFSARQSGSGGWGTAFSEVSQTVSALTDDMLIGEERQDDWKIQKQYQSRQSAAGTFTDLSPTAFKISAADVVKKSPTAFKVMADDRYLAREAQ